MTTTTLPTRPRRRWWFLALAILLPIVARVGMAFVERAELGNNSNFAAMMLFQFAVLIGACGIGVWFFALSGLARRTRLVVAGLGVGATIAAFATLRSVEFDGQMNPRPVYRWTPTPEQKLAEHRAATPKAEGSAILTVAPSDSPSFRGADGDGRTAGVALAGWTTPPTILWKQPAGGGHSGFAVAGNSAVTIEQIDNEEAVVCYERDTGKERWKHAYAAGFYQGEPMGGSGPRATPAIADGNVFSLGGQGDLVCLKGSNGERLWSCNIITDNGARNVDWGMSGSPLAVGSVVVVNPGGDSGIVAYDRATGAKRWTSGGGLAGYASPMRAVVNGAARVVVFDAAGIRVLDQETGKALSFQEWKSPMNMNSAQPLALGGGRIMLSSEKDNGAAAFDFSAMTPAPVWKNRKYSARYASPVYWDNHIYGLTDGRLICLDAKTGDVMWKDGSFGNGQILIVGDKLVLTAEKGSIHLVAADPTGLRELGSMPLFDHRTWNMPALAGDQLFVRTHREMACVRLPTIK